MEKLIPVINKLQDVFHSVGMLDTLDLPQIAVVGSQSSGKSSVIENIVGRDFLPRGTGIVTRRPLVLQLVNIKPKSNDEKKQGENQQNTEEWGEFLHIPNKRFYDFSAIREEIKADTDRVAGSNCGVSPLPIHLKIYSPHVVNLTLIDLPGMTKVPVGDQPKDIELQIRRLVLQYVSKPNCIILAVSPANSDIANSDSLKIAREVDKSGHRTIGVLTKLDLMDPGTDASDILLGKVIQLRRGFIGVVNRGQKDIETNKPIRKALLDEAKFFQTHPAYRNYASKMGTAYLAKTLNQILLNHIRQCLPEIKNKIAHLISQAQQRLISYGEPLTDASMSKGAMLLQLLTKFTTNFVEAIDGRSTNLTTNEMFGGSRINHIFTKKYTPYLLKMDACDNLSEQDIKIAIGNAKGPRTSLFVPEAAFEMLVKKQVRQLENPSLRCVDQVLEELLAIVDYCDKDLFRFPVLRERVREFVVDLLRQYVEPLKSFIQDLINIETAYINTNHPDFFGGGQTAIMLIEKLSMGKQSHQHVQNVPLPVTQQQQQQQQQHPKYTVSGQQPMHRNTMQQNKKNPSQTEKPKTEALKKETNNTEDWFSVDPPSAYRKQQPPITPIGISKRDDKKKKRERQKSNFLSNFFGQKVQEDDFLNNQQQIVQQQQQPTQSVEVEVEPEEPFKEKTSYTLSSVQTNSSNAHEEYNQAYMDRERMEIEIIRALLTSYFNIVRKSISDSVPKAIMHFLVNKSKANLQSELVRALYKDDLFGELLKENDEIAAKRNATAKMLKVLQRAQAIINEVRDLEL